MHRSLNCSHYTGTVTSSKVPRHQQFDLEKPPNKLEPKYFAGAFENPVVNPPTLFVVFTNFFQ